MAAIISICAPTLINPGNIKVKVYKASSYHNRLIFLKFLIVKVLCWFWYISNIQKGVRGTGGGSAFWLILIISDILLCILYIPPRVFSTLPRQLFCCNYLIVFSYSWLVIKSCWLYISISHNLYASSYVLYFRYFWFWCRERYQVLFLTFIQHQPMSLNVWLNFCDWGNLSLVQQRSSWK